MVAVYTKELISWWLIVKKFNETSFQNSTQSPTTTTTRSIEYPIDQRHKDNFQKQQHQPSNSLRIAINHAHNNSEECGGAQLPKPDWVITIREKIKQAGQEEVARAWGKLCIYRIPQCLRKGDENKAFIPQTVSLGPYHHGKKWLRNMDRHKWRALHQVLKRTRHDVKTYLDSIRELEEKAVACYEGKIGLSTNEFVEMMVLDGCFILELFQGATEGFKELGYLPNDPVFAMRGTMHSIQRDMIMLENQLPLFVLDRLLCLQLGRPEQRGMVAELAVRFFDPLMPTEPLSETDRNRLESSSGATFDPFSELDVLHCLDVFRRSLLRVGPKPEPRNWIKNWSHVLRVADMRGQQMIHCVTELTDSGIKFKKRKTDRFWDVKFENGILKIPRLLIHDSTESLFRNLIAFEQCHLGCSNDITSYVILMDNLINTPADVAYLHYHGIIEHWLGSDAEVANLFNSLCEEVVLDLKNSYLSRLSKQVNRYYGCWWNESRASLMHNYFSNPWAIISLAAAGVLLLLTLAQTFYGVYGYYRPR